MTTPEPSPSVSGELTENDILTLNGGSMNTRAGEWSIDLFRSQNQVGPHDPRPMLTAQVYGPNYDDTQDYVSFYLHPEQVQELHELTRRFLLLPHCAQPEAPAPALPAEVREVLQSLAQYAELAQEVDQLSVMNPFDYLRSGELAGERYSELAITLLAAQRHLRSLDPDRLRALAGAEAEP